MTIATREEWLSRSLPALKSIILSAGGPDFAAPLISIGFPSRNALSKHKQRIGECWSKRCTDTGQPTIMVSPVIENVVEVLATLLHELVHASVGAECGHRGAFKRVATAAGLVGKMTATAASPTLAQALHDIAESIGSFPHVKLNAQAIEDERKKQKTRMRLYECNKCNQKIRCASDTLSAIHIGDNGEMCGIFVLQAPDED